MELTPSEEAQIIAVLGPVKKANIPVERKILTHWKGCLPLPLTKIWANYGWVSLASGRIHLIDPALLMRLVERIFDHDPDFDGDTYAFAYGDMGEVLVWSERYGFGFLSPTLSTISMPNLTGQTQEPLRAQFMSRALGFPKRAVDAFDPQGQPLYDRLVEHLGPLPYGMIYGTMPVPPPLGGTKLEHYVLADVKDWLETVYSSIRVTLADWECKPPRMLRLIGDPWPEGMKGNSPL